jgi:hypothetical protein
MDTKAVNVDSALPQVRASRIALGTNENERLLHAREGNQPVGEQLNVHRFRWPTLHLVPKSQYSLFTGLCK